MKDGTTKATVRGMLAAKLAMTKTTSSTNDRKIYTKEIFHPNGLKVTLRNILLRTVSQQE
jgi:hypothetical protein